MDLLLANNPIEHIDDNLTKGQHAKALEDSGVTQFVPYTMRRTSLTRFEEAADHNIFAVAQIAMRASQQQSATCIHKADVSTAFLQHRNCW